MFRALAEATDGTDSAVPPFQCAGRGEEGEGDTTTKVARRLRAERTFETPPRLTRRRLVDARCRSGPVSVVLAKSCQVGRVLMTEFTVDHNGRRAT